MKKYFFTGLLLTLFLISACTPTTNNSELPAPNVFLRGIESTSGVQYTATFIKPSAEIEMRDVQVEITLPAKTTLTGIGVPRQVGVAEIRENGATRTLAWNIPLVRASQQLDVLSFNVPVKISGSITFFMRWQDTAGVEHIEHFDDVPPVTNASESEAELVVTESGYQAMGKSGVMVSAPITEPPLALTVRVLPISFNPPVEFGAFWWCSLAEMNGVPSGESVDVAVSLRRPIAPFTKLALFQQNADGSWLLLPNMGTVTADGLSVVYAHPGGLVASGGEEGLQPAQVNLEEATDGTSNTVAFAESPSQPDNAVQTGVDDGTNNTIIIDEPNPVPPPVTDGTNNTIIIGEETSAPAISPTNGSVDGTNNTIIIGEATSAPAFSPTTDAVDGTNNTIIIGEETSAPAFSPTTDATDGTSNTVIIGEVTLTPLSALVTPIPETSLILTFTPSTITGIITPESEDRATSTPRPTQVIRIVTATPQPETSVAVLPTRTLAPTLALPVVAFNVPAYMEPGYTEESGEIRVVIFKQEAGFLQCQSGGLICFLLNRTAMP